MNNTNHSNDGRRSGDPCPDCGSPIFLRKNKQTKGYFLGCSQFPTCDWACLPHPIDVKVRRARDYTRRRAYCIAREHREEAQRERYWASVEEESRVQYLLRDEVAEEGPYTLWDALRTGDIL